MHTRKYHTSLPWHLQGMPLHFQPCKVHTQTKCSGIPCGCHGKLHKYHMLLLSLLLVLMTLSACSSGHLGGNEIAFIRNGQLWTIDPDGANAFAIVQDTSPVLSYSWSPSHHVLVYRSLDPDFAKTTAGQHIENSPLTLEPGDQPSAINTISIDGGSPITTMFSSATIRYSSPFWTTDGTHLVFRQENTTPTNPQDTLWLVAQDDQPGGIAAQTLPHSYAIPSITAITNLAIGNSTQGVFTTTLAGTQQHYLLQGQLPGHPLPATLERLLWQPAHAHPALLYAVTSGTSLSINTASPQVQLLLRLPDGTTKTLGTCQCTQFAWSPDGNTILYSTGTSYTLLNLTHATSFTVNGEPESIPYWSPDSTLLVLDSLHTLSLISLATKQQTMLLNSAVSTASATSTITIPAQNALLHPIPDSIWAADSRHFLFLTRGRTQWQSHALTKQGLYTVTLDAHAQVQGSPTLVDAGNDIQAGWSYEDANTSFLFS